MISLSLSFIFLIILTLFAAYCSASETSFFSLSAHKIKVFHQDHDPKKRLIAQMLSQPRDLLVTVFMLNTLANILIQNVASSMFGHEAGWGLKVGVPLVTTLVFGEIVPKYMGLQNNVALSYWLVPSLYFFEKLLAPIRRWIVAATAPISRIMFFFLKREKPMSAEELEHLLKQSQEQGLLKSEEVELLYGYLDFQNKQLREVMWPREDILFYDRTQPLKKLVNLFVVQECTRVPVCEGSFDNVIGIIDAYHFFKHQHRFYKPQDLDPYLYKPFYVPETTTAKNLLKMLDQHNYELALIVNEYGTLVGLVAREDLVEVVIGQVKDLRDSDKLYIVEGENEVIASGKWELEGLNELFNVNLESPNHMLTVGGWLTEQLGEIPKAGAKHETPELFFQILSAHPNRINRVYIRRLKGQDK